MKRIVTNAVRRAKEIELHEGGSRDNAIDDSWAEMAAGRKSRARYCIGTSAGTGLPTPWKGASLQAGTTICSGRLRLANDGQVG